ncbi:MAG: radical SAM protein [Treponema sp.]|nr:radical SAM protein [Treponema sp.]
MQNIAETNEKTSPEYFGFQWHITSKCPGQCAHCYQSEGQNDDELSLDALKHIADGIMRALPCPVTINVTGGEPLAYRAGEKERAVFGLLEHLCGFENLDELNIITSGMGVDADALSRLRALPRLAQVKVSLESHDKIINDRLRWPGNYEMALKSIRALTGAGLSVVIMSTLSRYNYICVKGLRDLSEDIGASGVIFERFVPLGRGAQEMGDATLERAQWDEVLRALAEISCAETSKLAPYKAFWVEGDAVRGAPCCLGRTSMALMPDGTVYPCRRVPRPIGKLPGDGMERILAKLGPFGSTPQLCYNF